MRDFNVSLFFEIRKCYNFIGGALNMIIDFHAHIFPDKLAPKAIPILEQAGGIKAYTDGTLNNLIESMNEANIDYSIGLSVATKPSQVESINNFILEAMKSTDRIIFFGAMHPLYENYTNELIRLKNAGIKGIKLHPEYQGLNIDDEHYISIIDKAFELGLIVIIHAGVDIAYPNDVKASPDRILNLLNNLKHQGRLVLAHMGGWMMWDEVYSKLLGKKLYIDTSFSFGTIKAKTKTIKMLDYKDLKKFIAKHGSDKILFATDSPWSNQSAYVNYFNGAKLSKEDYNKIMGINALKLLDLWEGK